MDDSERDAMLARVDERTHNMEKMLVITVRGFEEKYATKDELSKAQLRPLIWIVTVGGIGGVLTWGKDAAKAILSIIK